MKKILKPISKYFSLTTCLPAGMACCLLLATSVVFASNDRLPEPMVGQTIAVQGAMTYYGGFTGNEAVLNYNAPGQTTGTISNGSVSPNSSTGYVQFGFDKGSLIDATGCITDTVFQLPTNRCFYSNSSNGNVKVMSSRTYVNAGSNQTPVLELAALYYPPKATIVGDAYLGTSDLDNFAYWGRNLIQTEGGIGSSANDTFWSTTGYSNALADWNSDQFKQYTAKITELKGEATADSDLPTGPWYLQTSDGSIQNVGTTNNDYPQGRVWYNSTGLLLINPISFSGTGTIIVNGDLTINSGVTITTTDPNSMLGFIVLGDVYIGGNNTINAAIFSGGSTTLTGGKITFSGGNVDLIGSFVANKFNSLTGPGSHSNIRFYYDKRLDNGWPPGFRSLNMPQPTEN